MLRKSFICSVAISASLANASQTSDDAQSNSGDVIFPSKTYFMMAVDRHIANHVKPADMSKYLGIDELSADDEKRIYSGVRKAILREAASKWDSGEARHYGRDLGQMVGWSQESSRPGYELQNRITLFRYALESDKATSVLERYENNLAVTPVVLTRFEAIKEGNCDKLALKSHYSFYEQLSSFDTINRQTLRLASRFESLSSCQKCAVSSLMSSDSDQITPDTLLNSIVNAQQSSDPKALLSLISPE